MGVLMYILLLQGLLVDDVYGGTITTIPAQFGKVYTLSTTVYNGYMLDYQYSREHNSLIRLTTSLSKKHKIESISNPAQVVVRQKSAVQSWNLPLEILQGIRFSSVSRKLCAAAQELSVILPVSVEVTTLSQNPIQFSVYAELQTNLSVSIGPKYNIAITQSSPEYYEYTFDENDDSGSVTLYITSEDEYPCSQVTIQEPECPIEDPMTSLSTGVPYQTFLKKTAIIIERPLKFSSVYIVFSVTPFDLSCPEVKEDSNIEAMKVKNIEFWIEGDADVTRKYAPAFLASSLGYCGGFCVLTIIICLIIHCRKEEDTAQRETSAHSSESSPSSEEHASEQGGTDSNDPIEPSNSGAGDTTLTPLHIDHNESGQYSLLNESGQHSLLKEELKLSDTTKDTPANLQKKFHLYLEILIILFIFYFLPAMQLFLVYQKYLNFSGNQQVCYYNFLCARKLGPFHSFNNLFSNIGYIVFGGLFIIIVRVRSCHATANEKSGLNGISRQCGILYAMGSALIAEGIMSACYHVCPNTTNFQFDTTFMYILVTLLLLRLHQSRHCDITPTAQVAYYSLAAVVIFVVVGLVYNTRAFWGVFTALYFLSVIYLSIKFYYVGQFEFNTTLLGRMKDILSREGCRSFIPKYPRRFWLLLFVNLANMAGGLYGAIAKPPGFATFMLYVGLGNLGTYLIYYCIMKLYNGESIRCPCVIFGILAIGFWIIALFYFSNKLTDYSKNIPAESRNRNAHCILLDFFDGHDIWHFASAGALFCTFVVVLFIDDDLKTVKKEDIKVF